MQLAHWQPNPSRLRLIDPVYGFGIQLYGDASWIGVWNKSGGVEPESEPNPKFPNFLRCYLQEPEEELEPEMFSVISVSQSTMG